MDKRKNAATVEKRKRLQPVQKVVARTHTKPSSWRKTRKWPKQCFNAFHPLLSLLLLTILNFRKFNSLHSGRRLLLIMRRREVAKYMPISSTALFVSDRLFNSTGKEAYCHTTNKNIENSYSVDKMLTSGEVKNMMN